MKYFPIRGEISKLTIAATGATSWRSENVKHRRNEIFIDVMESVNVLFSAHGTLLKSEVSGVLKIKCLLSGMPECKLGLNDVLASGEGVSLADTHFHQSVRLHKFDAERAVTFVPPDGVFDLMTYRVTENVAVPFLLVPVIERLSGGVHGVRYSVSVKVKAQFQDASIFALNVTLTIPFISTLGKISSERSSGGKLSISGSSLVWKIAKFPGNAEFIIQAEVQTIGGVNFNVGVAPLGLDFEIPMYTSSGLRVRFLKVVEKSNYKPTKWISENFRQGMRSVQDAWTAFHSRMTEENGNLGKTVEDLRRDNGSLQRRLQTSEREVLEMRQQIASMLRQLEDLANQNKLLTTQVQKWKNMTQVFQKMFTESGVDDDITH
ncbi:protein binding, partial [Perkinsus sp. BL_2016]